MTEKTGEPDRRFRPLRHGTASGYSRGDRCDDCREAYRVYQREYMRRFRAKHGATPRGEGPQERRQRVYEAELEQIRAGRSKRVAAYVGSA